MADRLHLAPKHRRLLEALLREHLPDVEVWAYGSRVSGKSHDGSDLDLVLRGPGLEEIPLGQLGDFDEAVRESTIPFLVEARDWARVPERFQQEIERDYVVMVECDEYGNSCHDWPMVTVNDISEKVGMGPFGSSIKVSTFVADGVPIISGQHLRNLKIDDSVDFNFITNEHAQRLVNANVFRGDIIFTHAGNIGQAAYIPENSAYSRYVISQRQFFLRCNREKALPDFVTMYFKSPQGQHQLLANSSQVGVPSIARPVTYLRSIEIPLPPVPQQQAIAHILGTLDDKIELNRRMNEALEAIARALFKSWFVDFDPVRAKMEGRDTGLPRHIADLFPERFIASKYGKIPEGWKPQSLEKIASLNPENWKPSRPPENVRYVDLANTKWGRIERVELYPWERAPSRARRILRKNDTIVSTVRPGNGSFAFVDEDGLTGSTGFAVIRPDQAMDRTLIWCAATSSENIDRLSRLADGGAYPAVQPSDVLSTPVVVPSPEVRAAFSCLSDSLLNRMEGSKRESCHLATIRDALLPKLISGDIRQDSAEQTARDVQ